MNLTHLFTNTLPTTIGVFTDLEPDDVAALHLLAPVLRQPSGPLYFCVGEGNLDKTAMMAALLAELQIVGATVIAGAASKKTYPADFVRVFGATPEPATADVLEAAARIESIAGAAARHLMLVLKPPRELLHLSAALVAKTTVVAYGSFNFRALGGAGSARFAELANDVMPQTIVYESFFVTGSENSVTQSNAPQFFEHARTHAPRLLGAIEAWNAHIAVDRLEAVRDLSAQMIEDFRARNWPALHRAAAARSRASKVVDNIVAADGCQMVLADVGLATLLVTDAAVPLRRGRIAFDATSSFTQIVDDPDGRVHFVGPIPFAEMIAKLQALKV